MRAVDGYTAAMKRPALSRRELIAGTVGAGFALAVQPISAATITTSADGLEVADVRLDGDVAAYLAWPAKRKTKPPIVLVVHEIFGVHEHIRDVCRRLAKLGYAAIAPDLFARQGDVSKLADNKEIFAKVVSKVPDAQVLSDLDRCVPLLKTKGADTSRVAVTGFCWGGRIAWLYAAHTSAVRAGVAWYGRLVGDKDALHPQNPIDVAGTLKAPVLGLYGGQDQGIPVATVEEMRKALAAGGAASKRSQIQVYADAGHAFFADYRPSYRADAAADGWKRMLDWFKTNGVAP
jgi:carboxymethylenebutenolidase